VASIAAVVLFPTPPFWFAIAIEITALFLLAADLNVNT
jgi:hypothetical protein